MSSVSDPVRDPVPLTKEDYLAAVKKLPKGKEEQFLCIQFHGNSERIILPHKEGVELLNALQSSFTFRHRWSEAPLFQPLGEDLQVQGMTSTDVETIKVAKLLGIPVDDAKRLRNQT